MIGWVDEVFGIWYISRDLTPFGRPFTLPEQGFAILTLISIFLYNGKQWPHSKKLRYA